MPQLPFYTVVLAVYIALGPVRMPIEHHVFKKSIHRDALVFSEVSAIADDFAHFLRTPEIEHEISNVHKHGATSTEVQKIVHPGVTALGFASEKKQLFATYSVPALRPDFYKKIGTTGILLEVERGKTIANNMDLLDLWKCHICEHADFLFLLVPNKRHAQSGNGTRPYAQVKKRISTFFESDNYVNVEAAFLFGYARFSISSN